jgi:putative transposase
MPARSSTVAGPQPTVIELSDRQQRILKQLLRRQTSTQRLVRRVNIILAAADGNNNEQIAKGLGLHRESVRQWRERWLSAAVSLAAVEAKESDDKPLVEAIESVLADAYRSGAPSCFSAEQIVQIIAVACEEPQASNLPITHWTPQDLADEVVKRGLVESISARSAGRFLKRDRSQAAFEPLLAEFCAGRARAVPPGSENGV